MITNQSSLTLKEKTGNGIRANGIRTHRPIYMTYPIMLYLLGLEELRPPFYGGCEGVRGHAVIL